MAEKKLAEKLDVKARRNYRSVTAIKVEAQGRVVPGISMSGEAVASVTCNGRTHRVRASTEGMAVAGVLGAYGELAGILANRILRASPC